jgi:FkbM family methyltransferase
MRTELLYNPRLLCERLAAESVRRRRLARLRGTEAARLSLGHIDSLELLDIARPAGIDVIYDIGANVGTWSLLAKSLIPGAQIHAFEPLPKHQRGFLDNFSSREDVTLHSIALGSANAAETLHVTDFSDASSMLPPNEASRSQFGVREVSQLPLQVFRLDDYRLEKQLPLPDLIKLDIQGYELEALKGAPECLRSAKAIIAEVSFIEYYDGQCLFHDLAAYLAEFGLFIRAFGVNTPTGKPVMQTDVLFMRAAKSIEGVKN